MIPHQNLKKGSSATLLFLFILLLPKLGFTETIAFSESHLNGKIGQAIFEKLWVFAPSSTKSSDGLGPFYNARSCHQCHDPSKEDKMHMPASLVIQLSIEPDSINENSKKILKQTGFIPEPVYGKQLQTFSYPGAKAEADIFLTYKEVNITFPDGEIVSLSAPEYHFSNLGYGELDKNLRFSPRIAPRMKELAWIESISDQYILSHADPDDKDADGISGKVNWVWDSIVQTAKIGRFGWKAAKASLEQQNLAALSTDIGVSSWLFPETQGDCTPHQSDCVKLAKSTGTHLSKLQSASKNIQDTNTNTLLIEASKDMTDLLRIFTSTIGQQKRVKPSPDNFNMQAGQHLFKQIACQNCHLSALKNNHLRPYTDLLLHDMGTGLADNRREFDASGSEWRTAPLWGISAYLKHSPNPSFLHDGRAKSIIEAILWHGGEAEKSKLAFMLLPKKERTSLIHFVESL